MLSLVRNCSHGSSTYLVEQKGTVQQFIKSATDNEGINNLHKEYEGLKWYYAQKIAVDVPPFDLEQVTDSYVRLITKKSSGYQLSPKSSLAQNYSLMQRIIEHYCDIWGTDNSALVPMHGDLSLDNIFIQNKEINIIDWEHFNQNSVPWGFDILYTLFETFWFCQHRRVPKNIPNESAALVNLVTFLLERCRYPEQIKFSLLSDIILFMKNNLLLWGEQMENFPMKFPILYFDTKMIENIDFLIMSALEKKLNA